MKTHDWTTAIHASAMRARGFVAVLVVAAMFGTVPTGATGTHDAAKGAKTLRLEIVENGTKFTVDSSPAFADGLPAYGAKLITEGYIYPAGTVSGTNGVLPDGSPEFPDKVIGHWTCRGWFVGDGAHTTTGPMVVTHQLLDFGPKAGDESITSDGFEYADVGLQIRRAITGGTGQYARARGEQLQTLLAFPNNAGGVTLGIVLEIAK